MADSLESIVMEAVMKTAADSPAPTTEPGSAPAAPRVVAAEGPGASGNGGGRKLKL